MGERHEFDGGFPSNVPIDEPSNLRTRSNLPDYAVAHEEQRSCDARNQREDSEDDGSDIESVHLEFL